MCRSNLERFDVLRGAQHSADNLATSMGITPNPSESVVTPAFEVKRDLNMPSGPIRRERAVVARGDDLYRS